MSLLLLHTHTHSHRSSLFHRKYSCYCSHRHIFKKHKVSMRCSSPTLWASTSMFFLRVAFRNSTCTTTSNWLLCQKMHVSFISVWNVKVFSRESVSVCWLRSYSLFLTMLKSYRFCAIFSKDQLVFNFESTMCLSMSEYFSLLFFLKHSSQPMSYEYVGDENRRHLVFLCTNRNVEKSG